jgi:nucleoside-triphosphatase THEP1
MTSKEKAKELFGKHYIVCQEYTEEIQCSIQAKQCALIAVDEILEMDLPIFEEDSDEFYDYWEQVKQEIKKL